MENITIHIILDGVNICRVWVKFETKHMVFCRKFNLLSQFWHFWGVIVLVHMEDITFMAFFVN